MGVNPAGDTIGEIFKRTREQKNLTIDKVNEDTKISVAVIRALEEDDMEAFASETYLKGFLKSYAKYLGLDPDRIWNMSNRMKGDVPEGKGTFWDIEESIKEEKLGSPRILQRIIVPLLIVAIAVLTFLYIKERRKENSEKVGEVGSAQTTSVCNDSPYDCYLRG